MLNRQIFRFATVMLLGMFCFQHNLVAAEEKMAWSIWEKMAQNPEDLSEVIAECEAFMKGRQTDQIAPVVVGILGWCYFKTERMPDGAKLLMSIEKYRTTPIKKAGSDLARTWLARIDIQLLKAALMIYYRKHQKFPEKLIDAIEFAEQKKGLKVPAKDRWGKPWTYDLVGFKTLTKVPKNQKYALSCTILGQYSDFAEALEMPYAGKIDLIPVKMGSTKSGFESVYFKKAGDASSRPILMKVGDRKSGVTCAFIGRSVIALTDGNHWKLFKR